MLICSSARHCILSLSFTLFLNHTVLLHLSGQHHPCIIHRKCKKHLRNFDNLFPIGPKSALSLATVCTQRTFGFLLRCCLIQETHSEFRCLKEQIRIWLRDVDSGVLNREGEHFGLGINPLLSPPDPLASSNDSEGRKLVSLRRMMGMENMKDIGQNVNKM